MKKRVYKGIAGALLLSLLAGAISFFVMSYKDRTYVSGPAYLPEGKANDAAAVIYYSRSGHSEAVAREVARSLNAPLARISSNSYPLDLAGQRKAIADARAGILPPVTVEPVDLRYASRIFLVSPTWMFRPATPLWAWVAQNDLAGKEVILITTGNSRFKQSETDAFAGAVHHAGGELISHIFLRRGRIFWQESREELLLDTRHQLAEFRRRHP